MTDQQYIDKAREIHSSDGQVEIDDGAVVSRGSDPGAYVAAWVWVYNGTDAEDFDAGIASEDEEDQGEHLPAPPEILAALRDLAEYVGGSDEPLTHPCGRAWDVIKRLRGEKSEVKA